MAAKDILTELQNANVNLRAKRSLKRSAETELAQAEARLSKATEAELAAEASYKAARSAVAKAYPEHNRG